MKKLFCTIMVLVCLTGSVLAAETFPLKDVSVESDFGISMVQGEITNNSGENYETAIFKMSFYDGNNKLLGAADIVIDNFQKGETVTFDGVSDKDLRDWKACKIRLDSSF